MAGLHGSGVSASLSALTIGVFEILLHSHPEAMSSAPNLRTSKISLRITIVCLHVFDCRFDAVGSIAMGPVSLLAVGVWTDFARCGAPVCGDYISDDIGQSAAALVENIDKRRIQRDAEPGSAWGGCGRFSFEKHGYRSFR